MGKEGHPAAGVIRFLDQISPFFRASAGTLFQPRTATHA
jgi:hypothetical protein